MGARVKKGRGGFTEINVTPLVDVMLVLLIVFDGRIGCLHVGQIDAPVKDAKLIVSITKDERVMLGETDVTSNLENELKNNVRVQTEKELYIRADEQAHYGVVARAVAAARSAGVTSLNLLVNPEIEERR